MRSRRAPRVTRDRTRATTSTIDFRVIYPTRTRARPAPARARAVRAIRERTHPSSIIRRHPRVTHPSIHPSTTLLRERRENAIVTYLARAHGDRSSSLRRVLDVGRHHGRGAGESRSHDWSSWSRCDERRSAPRPVAAPRPLVRFDRASRPRCPVAIGRSWGGTGDGPAECPNTHGWLARSPRPRSRHGRAWAHTTRARDRGDAGDIR